MDCCMASYMASIMLRSKAEMATLLFIKQSEIGYYSQVEINLR